MSVETIYSEDFARVLVAVAQKEGRLADLLNYLADGGLAMLQPDNDTDGKPIKLVLLDGAAFKNLYNQATSKEG